MREGLIEIVQSEPLMEVREAYFCQAGGGVREAITSSTFPERGCTRVVTYREQVRRNKTKGTPEAVRNGTASRGPRNHKKCVGSYETILLVAGGQNKIKIVF